MLDLSLIFSIQGVACEWEEHADFFRSTHPRPATSEWVTKNFRGQEKIILVDLAHGHSDVNVALQLYFILSWVPFNFWIDIFKVTRWSISSQFGWKYLPG